MADDRDPPLDPALLGVPSAAQFDAAYASGAPPWDIGRPQRALSALVDAGELRGRVLDAGCGTGEHALMAAAAGFEAVGVDASAVAVDRARNKAAARGLDVRFEVADARCLPALGLRFDSVVDCGLFHVFDDDDRARYVESLAGVTVAGGRLLLLCFSAHQPGAWGPRRVHQDEIRGSFCNGWHVESIEDARLEITLDADGVLAWLAVIARA